MSTKEHIVNGLDSLSESDLQQVSRYLAFLKYQSRLTLATQLSEQNLAAMYAEFADEDRDLANEGMDDYHNGLRKEDEA